MAKYDFGGGCACGLQKVCDCKHNSQRDGSKPSDPQWDQWRESKIDKMASKKNSKINYKYKEPEILDDLKNYLDRTYGEHYQGDEITCFDAWLSLDDAASTFRNTSLKYLWRYGKKNGNNKDDLLKAMHYIFMLLYNDHYKPSKNMDKP